MFETETRSECVAHVEVRLSDGSATQGILKLTGKQGLKETLNGPGEFVFLEAYDGTQSYVSKRGIREVRPLMGPKAIDFRARSKAIEQLDPYAVLGLRPGASPEQIRKAYHTLARTYHPDRYASAQLPTEVLEYLIVVVRRINAAHAALKARIAAP